MNWAWWDGKMPIEHYRMSTGWTRSDREGEPKRRRKRLARARQSQDRTAGRVNRRSEANRKEGMALHGGAIPFFVLPNGECKAC